MAKAGCEAPRAMLEKDRKGGDEALGRQWGAAWRYRVVF